MRLRTARQAIGDVVVGQEQAVDEVLIALLGGGHVLVEGVPGLGKTLLVQTAARVFDLAYSRIQFTPDLMPADVTGTTVLMTDETGQHRARFQPGPIFSELVLADEVNRATPKTQSALLEAMAEHQVTAGGERHPLPEPFFVFATQNPVEMEGTHPLPEAQVDRFFFKIRIPYPTADVLERIVRQTTGTRSPRAEPHFDREALLDLQAWVREVPTPDVLVQTAIALTLATQPDHERASERVRAFVRYGATPRAAQTLVIASRARALLEGRYNASLDDLEAVAMPALRHRVQLNFAGEAEGLSPEALLEDEVARVLREARARTGATL